MSIIKSTSEKVLAETWQKKILDGWSQSGVAMNVIKNKKRKLFEEKLNAENAWDWFRLILLIDVEWQLEWLEKTILYGVCIDKHWHKMDSGHRVTIFDLVDKIEGGIRNETRDVILHLRDIYEILFLRKDVQTYLDILNELEEDGKWIQLNIILSTYVLGPMQSPKPLLHYVVLMERYDLVRGLLSAASSLHKEFKSQTFLYGWINMKDDHGSTVLHIVAKQRRESWAKWFISNLADPLEKDDNGLTPFHYVIEKPYLEIFWSKVKNKNTDLLNDLMKSCDNLKALEWLVKHGASPYIHPNAHHNVGAMSLMVQYGGDPNVITPKHDWSSESIKEWILCGGGNVENYSELVIKHFYYKPPEWICLFLALHYNEHAIAFQWAKSLSDSDLRLYFDSVLGIVPKTEYMIKYRETVENVSNMCKEEYKTDINQDNNDEHL
jgi:ankyrin repeat protein